MKRDTPEHLSVQEDLNIDHLHLACLSFAHYLGAKTEVKKQACLYEAANHLMLLPGGEEGDEVYVQVWEAIRGRALGRAYIETDAGYNFIQATDAGGFNPFRVVAR